MSKPGRSTTKFSPSIAPQQAAKSASSATSSPSVTTSASSSNMSSHAAPPPSNPKARPGQGKRSSKPRESRPNKNKPYNSLDDNEQLFDDDLLLFDTTNFPRARRGQISINHLLDFSLPDRAPLPDSSTKNARRRRRSSNKAQDRIHLVGPEFVNANYRFVVDYRFDYRGQTMDPNLLLDHHQILRVIVPKAHNCPICLSDEIVAPRMISCGHIFCHSCLLSFLDAESASVKKPVDPTYYTPKKAKECPLCSEFVKPEQTIPVVVNDADERFEIPQVGHDVVLKLMARPIDSILPMPFSLNLNHQKIGNVPWYSDSEIQPYARIMKGGLKFIVDCYENDKKAILKQYEEDKLLYNDDGKYVQKAVQEIDMALELTKTSFANDYNEPNPLITSMNNLSLDKNQSGLDDTNCYFFYQTGFSSTTRFFLSPLDVKVLLKTYGSYSDFPTTLLLKVDNVSYGYMVTEQTLKRYKYMSHLPLGTEFAFIEVNWKNMLPPEIYKLFSKELSDRRRRLLAKLKREDRDKKTYETEQEQKTREFYMQENDGWGSYDFIGSQDAFPAEGGLHPLSDEELQGHEEEEQTATEAKAEPGKFATTVWGTKIPVSGQLDMPVPEEEDPFNTEELLKFALSKDQTQQSGKKKGRKKKLLVLSSGQTRDYK